MSKKPPKPSYEERLAASRAYRQKLIDDREARRTQRRTEMERNVEFKQNWRSYSDRREQFLAALANAELPEYTTLDTLDKQVVDDYLRFNQTTWAELQQKVEDVRIMRQKRADQQESERRALLQVATHARGRIGIGRG